MSEQRIVIRTGEGDVRSPRSPRSHPVGREAKEIGLREMAKMIGVSPTYQSKVERDEFPPPAEDKVRKIAKILAVTLTICWRARAGCRPTSRKLSSATPWN